MPQLPGSGGGSLSFIDRLHALEDAANFGNRRPYGNAQVSRFSRQVARRVGRRRRGLRNEEQLRDMLLLLEEMLRTQAGITTKRPAFAQAPFRAQQIFEHFEAVAVGVGATVAVLDPMRLLGADEVPDGMRGVLTSVEVVAQTAPAAAFDPRLFGTFTITVNGSPPPGWLALPVRARQVAAAALSGITSNDLAQPVPVPIKLTSGDVVRVSVTSAAATPGVINATGALAGYLYPVREDVHSIEGAVVD